jgi:hypothetical protein
LEEAVADVVGSSSVSEEEVRSALKHSAPGKAPGMDGLPVELYRRYADVCAPLLARVYTAIGRLNRVPVGFTEGVIKIKHKGCVETQVSNYRPLTLLCTDYRVLAKILAHRLKLVQGPLVAQEQTAFLPGRHIGESVLLLEMLPHTQKPTSEAVVVFCDMAKAYDTVSRAFLYQLLQEAGLGGGFLQWVQLLLTNTKSCACVNGYVSNPVQFAAGVRQGCPLAPQLYLFVGQALMQFLQAKGFGIFVGSRRLTGCQFADDVQVFLQSWQQLPGLITSLQVFRGASGQGLNLTKTKALVIGKALLFQLWLEHYRRVAEQQQQAASQGGATGQQHHHHHHQQQ